MTSGASSLHRPNLTVTLRGGAAVETVEEGAASPIHVFVRRCGGLG